MPANYELASEQMKLPVFKKAVKADVKSFPELTAEENDAEINVNGEGFSLVFDKAAGLVKSFKSGDTELLTTGLVPNFWRAPIDNDYGNGLDIRCKVWRKAGQNRKVTSAKLNKIAKNQVAVQLVFDLVDEKNEKIADYKSTYTVYGSGDVKVNNTFKMTKDDLPEIPLIGMNMVMPRQFDQMGWLGRGPHESYWDRKTSAFVGKYSGSVAGQYWAYLRPQENGNKTDVRWMTVTNSQGTGIMFVGEPLIEVSALHNIMEDFESVARTDGRQVEGVETVNRHTTDVKPRDLTSVNVNYKQMGVGGDNSWGAWTHEEYRLTGKEYSYSFRMKAITKEDDPVKLSAVKL